MLRFFKIKNKRRLCSICNEYVDSEKIHVILEINTVPPTLLFFHFQHYECFLDTLNHYFKNKEEERFKTFLKQSICEIEQESKMAKEQGFASDFENDLSEVRNFLIYKDIKKTAKMEFMCALSKNKITIKDCFKCEMGKVLLCNKCIFFSIKPKIYKYELKKRI